MPVRSDIPVVYLKPGELRFSRKPEIVSTVLGSCISVTLFHPQHKIGAISHALLPSGEEEGTFKYVDRSLAHMIKEFKNVGIGCWELEVKLFGGADMFKCQTEAPRGRTVGRQNVEKSVKLIESAGLKLVNSDVGGFLGRKLFFYTHTGEVFLKKIRKKNLGEINT